MVGAEMMLKAFGIDPDVMKKTSETFLKGIADFKAQLDRIEAKIDALSAPDAIVVPCDIDPRNKCEGSPRNEYEGDPRNKCEGGLRLIDPLVQDFPRSEEEWQKQRAAQRLALIQSRDESRPFPAK